MNLSRNDAAESNCAATQPSKGLPRLVAVIRGSLIHFIRFGLTSAVSFFTITGGTFVLHEWLALTPELAFGVALVSVFLLNFALLRYYVFPERSVGLRRQFLGCVMVSIVFRSCEYGAFLIVHSFLDVQYLLTTALVLVGSFLAKFTVLRLLVFPKHPCGVSKASPLTKPASPRNPASSAVPLRSAD